MDHANVLISRINQRHKFLVLDPASKMNNTEEYKKTPMIPEQTGKHHQYKYNGGERSGFKNSKVKGHANFYKK